MEKYFSSETIIAVATSLAGDAGVGILRISGEQALVLAQQFMTGFKAPTPRYLHRVKVFELPEKKETFLDDGLAVWFPKGHSFTGEDVVELQVHGGRYLLKKILKEFLSSGRCRLALPGEFSFRAVRAGKLPLLEAEALQQIITAESDFEIQAIRNNLSHEMLRLYEALVEKIRDLAALTELSIDFLDQDVEVLSWDLFQKRLKEIQDEVQRFIVTYEQSSRLSKGLKVCFLGQPNAGKSSIFNQILRQDRAIVSDIPGTTRDVLDDRFLIGPYLLTLVDTAGLRKSQDSIEEEGIRRSRQAAKEADLLVMVVDAQSLFFSSFDMRDQGLMALSPDLIILNKIDLLPQGEEDDLIDRFNLVTQGCFERSKIFMFSVKNSNPESLIRTLENVLDSKIGLGKNLCLPTERQKEMLDKAQNQLKVLENHLSQFKLTMPEYVAEILRNVANCFLDIAGLTSPDDLLGRIFSKFCIGK